MRQKCYPNEFLRWIWEKKLNAQKQSVLFYLHKNKAFTYLKASVTAQVEFKLWYMHNTSINNGSCWNVMASATLQKLTVNAFICQLTSADKAITAE